MSNYYSQLRPWWLIFLIFVISQFLIVSATQISKERIDEAIDELNKKDEAMYHVHLHNSIRKDGSYQGELDNSSPLIPIDTSIHPGYEVNILTPNPTRRSSFSQLAGLSKAAGRVCIGSFDWMNTWVLGGNLFVNQGGYSVQYPDGYILFFNVCGEVDFEDTAVDSKGESVTAALWHYETRRTQKVGYSNDMFKWSRIDPTDFSDIYWHQHAEEGGNLTDPAVVQRIQNQRRFRDVSESKIYTLINRGDECRAGLNWIFNTHYVCEDEEDVEFDPEVYLRHKGIDNIVDYPKYHEHKFEYDIIKITDQISVHLSRRNCQVNVFVSKLCYRFSIWKVVSATIEPEPTVTDETTNSNVVVSDVKQIKLHVDDESIKIDKKLELTANEADYFRFSYNNTHDWRSPFWVYALAHAGYCILGVTLLLFGRHMVIVVACAVSSVTIAAIATLTGVYYYSVMSGNPYPFHSILFTCAMVVVGILLVVLLNYWVYTIGNLMASCFIAFIALQVCIELSSSQAPLERWASGLIVASVTFLVCYQARYVVSIAAVVVVGGHLLYASYPSSILPVKLVYVFGCTVLVCIAAFIFQMRQHRADKEYEKLHRKNKKDSDQLDTLNML